MSLQFDPEVEGMKDRGRISVFKNSDMKIYLKTALLLEDVFWTDEFPKYNTERDIDVIKILFSKSCLSVTTRRLDASEDL